KVEQKKNVRYVQTLDEMARELQDRGIAGSRLVVAAPEGDTNPPRERGEAAKVFQGDELKALINVLDEIEGPLTILERRGFNVPSMLGRIKDGKFPTFRVLLGKHEHWFFT